MPLKLCEIRGLEKSFGTNKVLRGIDLDLHEGEVTVLMGANGAGKSTLVRILSGLYRPSGGQILFAGERYSPSQAADAIKKGIVTVHQLIDDGVIPDLDVATNLMLDRLTAREAKLFVNDAALRRDAAKIAENMGISVDVRTRVSDLGVADRQMIAIARAMARSARILILDEPTSSLSATEAERLFRLIKRLRQQGVAILYISHRMSDIRQIADRIVTMRDGVISGVFEDQPLDYEGAVAAMLGHSMTEVDITPVATGEPVLSMNSVQLGETASPFSCTIGDGEVVAVTGLLGSGKSKFAEIVFGLSAPISGSMHLDGTPYKPKSAADAIGKGVFMSPKDRGNNAVIPGFDIANNMSLPFLASFSFLSFLGTSRQRAKTDDMIRDIGIKCRSNTDDISTLSGGNQQKVMIARWLMMPCRVLLLDEPFQGVDIGARRDIGRHIRMTAKGRATLVFVAEIDEALEVADRILVLNEGNLAGEHINSNVDLAALVTDVTGTTVAAEMPAGMEQ